jgi:hypothetical protein
MEMRCNLAHIDTGLALLEFQPPEQADARETPFQPFDQRLQISLKLLGGFREDVWIRRGPSRSKPTRSNPHDQDNKKSCRSFKTGMTGVKNSP